MYAETCIYFFSPLSSAIPLPPLMESIFTTLNERSGWEWLKGQLVSNGGAHGLGAEGASQVAGSCTER